MKKYGILLVGLVFVALSPAGAQQSYYTGSNVTGRLVHVRTVNPLQLSQQLRMQGGSFALGREVPPKVRSTTLRPPLVAGRSGLSILGAAQSSPLTSLPVIASNVFGFNGITHLDQRFANGGNQFSVEPPNPSIAVGNGYIVAGVNNGFRVYSVSGAPLLPVTLSSNELFGVTPAFNRTTGIIGVFPTDMRVFFDQTISRWFVLQRAQDFDTLGNALNSSKIYLAVSQTADPVGNYQIYQMDTTNAQNPGCPCIADYPQIGADQYGFYISTNEFDTATEQFVDVAIFAISKASLAIGAAAPTVYRFLIPYGDGFGFSIHPAMTPPDASYFLASGGLQYFVSAQGLSAVSQALALWAMTNTASLGTTAPNLVMTRIVVPTLAYAHPFEAPQKPGATPYGSSFIPPRQLALLDGNDHRIQSVVYSGSRIYATLGTQINDETGRSAIGGAYFILSTAMRAGTLNAAVLRQGYVVAQNNHILRPAIAVNGRGRGAIAFTLVGPDYYPSAAFLPIDTFTTAPAIQVAAYGVLPEDGFTGEFGIARWGDYSTAVVGNDGAVWMVTEYIPNAPRSELANWGTFLWRYVP